MCALAAGLAPRSNLAIAVELQTMQPSPPTRPEEFQMPIDVSSLNKQFAIPGVAEIISANGGLPAIHVTAKNAAGDIYLHGGHVTSWTPAGAQDVLWCSKKSLWQPDKPIRGGVPICFPWFGPKADDPTAPPHGFARLLPWQLESIKQQNGEVTVTVLLRSGDATRKWWPHDFELRHRVTFLGSGPELVMQMELTNRGNTELAAQEAQHTYFAVGDVRQILIRGLAAVTYRSKVEAVAARTHTSDIRITSETDRLYLDTPTPIIIEDPVLQRRISLTKQNSRTTVVWNPWIAKAKAMPDFADDEWSGMICVETCNVAEFAARVAPGKTHIMASTLRVDRL
jgi:glucose-6-phosphate 1-epimerase